jgi:hypothetical protein
MRVEDLERIAETIAPGHTTLSLRLAPDCHAAAGVKLIYQRGSGIVQVFCKKCAESVCDLEIAGAPAPATAEDLL